MSLRTLGILQWIGLLLGAGVWAAQHLTGLYITNAACGPTGSVWGVDNAVWQGALMGSSLAFVLVAEAAAVVVFAETRGADFGGGPPGEGRFGGRLPETRLHFFATAAILANAVFALIIALDGAASIAAAGCRQG